MPASLVPCCSPVAVVVVPSFTGFPWVGLACIAAILATAVICIAVSSWAVATTREIDVASSERWRLLFSLLPAVTVTAILFAGRWALPAAGVLLIGMLVPFVRRRDATLPESRAFLSANGLRNVTTEVRDRLRQWRGDDSGERALSLREQVVRLVSGWRDALVPAGRGRGATGQTRGRAKRGSRKSPVAAAGKDAFTLFKQDGTAIMSLPLEGGDKTSVSANVRNTRKILVAAARAGLKDLVFEPGEKHYLIRAGTREAMKDMDKVAIDAARGIVSTLRVVAGMGVNAAGGSGTFGMAVGEARYDVQVTSLAEASGEKLLIAIRPAAGGTAQLGLDGLGLRPKGLEQLRSMTRKPHGLVLIVGPPGSGRTTTAYALVREIDVKAKKVMTIEETIESRLDGVAQITVETHGGATFGGVMKMVMKQDPDVILLGNLPDRATVELACQAALTGHVVFAVMEARDTLSAITDLMDMGIEPMLLQTALTGIVAQRQARRLCPKCRVPADPPEAVLRKCNLQPGTVQRVYRSREKGCPACSGTGYRGVVALHEVLMINEQVRRLITAPLPTREMKAAAVLNGMLTLQLEGLAKALHGETSVEEVLAVTS